jgi:hypothetical protein
MGLSYVSTKGGYVPFLRKNDRANTREKLAAGLGLEAGKRHKAWFADRIQLIVLPNQMALQTRNNYMEPWTLIGNLGSTKGRRSP